MIQYTFRDGPVIIRNANKADPQKIGEALEKARKATPTGDDVRETVVRDAKNRRHPIHNHLEWDDTIAGHKYRLDQVNDLLRVIHVVNEDDANEPAFISITPDRGRRQFWTPAEIRTNADLQIAALRAAKRDLEAFERRHRALSDICQDVAAVREKVERRLAKNESRDAQAA